MKLATKSLGTLLLAVLLILQGLIGLNVPIPLAQYVLPILAIASGVCLLLGR